MEETPTRLRYFFVVINTLFLVLGLLMLGLSIWLQFSSPIHEILAAEHTSRVVIYGMLIVGCFALFVGLCGVLGGIFLKPFLLGIYLAVTASVLLLVLVIFSYGLANRDVLKSETNNVWESLSDETKYIIQYRFNCCGFQSHLDWNRTTLHQSCYNTSAPNSDTPWQNGCYASMLKWVDENSLAFGLAVGFFFFLMVAQVVVTIYLIIESRRNSVDEEEKQPSSNQESADLTSLVK